MRGLAQDLRHALRTLRAAPAFTLTAVATLALGIGATSALFTVVNSVLLRPLPYREPERLVRIFESNPGRGWPLFSASYLNYADWTRESRAFEHLAAWRNFSFNLTGVDEPERIGGGMTTASLFPVLGATPVLGRNFLPEEETAKGPRVVILSDGLWKRRFGSDPAILGRTLLLNDVPRTVVGVLSPDFNWYPGADVFVPLELSADTNRSNHVLAVFGRLRPDVSLEQASAELKSLAGSLEKTYPDSNAGWGVRLMSFDDWIVDEGFRRAIGVLLGAVGMVLLIACANVASLLLARAAARRREIAVRVALGAGRLRLVQHFLVETGVVSLLGGGAGLLLGTWGVALLRSLDQSTIPRLDEVSLDARAVLFTLALCGVATLVAGLGPAIQASRTGTGEALKESGRGGGVAAAGARLRRLLVAGQFAVSLVLLIGAGLLVRSFWQLQRIDVGFDRERVLAVQINLPGQRYANNESEKAFYRTLRERLAALPGVEAVGASSILPFEGGDTAQEVTIEGLAPASDGTRPSADWRLISPGHFKALGVPILAGRDFEERDDADEARVVLVSETFARRFWPGQDAVGKRMKPGGARNWLTVVGVAADIYHYGLDGELAPMLYFPYTGSWNPMSLALRAKGDPAALVPAVRAAVRALDAQLPIAAARPLGPLVERSMGPRRFNATLLAVLAAIALVLAAVGLYGATAYAVALRTHEIGVRMALGARPGDVLRMVVGQGVRVILAGIAVGLVSAFLLTRSMASLLFGVTPGDPATFAGICALLVAVALLASYLPARRATQVDPVVALRAE